MAAKGGGSAGEVPGGQEEDGDAGGCPEEELDGEGGGQGLVGVGVAADGEGEDEAAHAADGGRDGQLGE